MGEMWFGHYRLDRLLGSSGTGEVWLARDTGADRLCAVKVLAATHAADPDFRQRFTREARLAAQVRGRHLVPIHSFGELDGRPYIDMKFVEGADIAALLRRNGPMPPATAVEIVAQTATALDTAHRAGLVHRDVKPSNIMVSSTGTAYLIDFGTAHRTDQAAITASGNVVGTLAYMAPERFDGAASARSDQYSLACVLYACLTGRPPFGDGDSVRLLRAHLLDAPPLASAVNPAVPPALDAVLARGMAKDPEQRFASAGELASAGYAAVTGLDVATVEAMASAAVDVTAPTTVTTTPPQRPIWITRTAESPTPRAGRTDAWRSATRTLETRTAEPETIMSPRLAVAAIAALVAISAAALWLGRPDSPDSPSATPRAPSSEVLPRAELPSHAPAAQAPAPVFAPTHVAPAQGHSCDPAVDGGAVAVDGTPLTCTTPLSGGASWIPLSPQGGGAPGSAGAEDGSSGNDDQDKSEPVHPNQGNGNGNANKPDIPVKPDKPNIPNIPNIPYKPNNPNKPIR